MSRPKNNRFNKMTAKTPERKQIEEVFQRAKQPISVKYVAEQTGLDFARARNFVTSMYQKGHIVNVGSKGNSCGAYVLKDRADKYQQPKLLPINTPSFGFNHGTVLSSKNPKQSALEKNAEVIWPENVKHTILPSSGYTKLESKHLTDMAPRRPGSDLSHLGSMRCGVLHPHKPLISMSGRPINHQSQVASRAPIKPGA